MPIPLDNLTLHNDDYTRTGWFDTPTGKPPKKGSIAVIAVNKDAVEKREHALLLERIARGAEPGRP